MHVGVGAWTLAVLHTAQGQGQLKFEISVGTNPGEVMVVVHTLHSQPTEAITLLRDFNSRRPGTWLRSVIAPPSCRSHSAGLPTRAYTWLAATQNFNIAMDAEAVAGAII
jgi:hypothetical protein